MASSTTWHRGDHGVRFQSLAQKDGGRNINDDGEPCDADQDEGEFLPYNRQGNAMTEYQRRRRRGMRFLTALCLLVTTALGGFLWRVRVDVEELPQPRFEDMHKILPGYVELRRHVVTLSSENMQGRGTGTPGEQRAVRYIAEQFRNAGCDSIEELPVPLSGALTQSESTSLTLLNRSWSYREDFWITMTTSMSSHIDDNHFNESLNWAQEAVIFGGFCIHHDRHDDFMQGSSEVRDRIVLCLVGEPDSLFLSHDRRSYHARWIYKVEELRRRGAKGILLVHTTESAGYGWSVIEAMAVTQHVRLRTDNGTRPMTFWGWIRGAKLNEFGMDTEKLLDEARRPEFRARISQLTCSGRVQVQVNHFEGINVLATMLPSGENETHGSVEDREEAVVMNAHHDHLGIGQGGEIYYGALDNASGVAKMLVIAAALGRLREAGRCCKRKIFFASVTAEEAVLLGSQYLAQSLKEKNGEAIVATINFDGMNVWGPTTDAVAIGAERSTLAEVVQRAARLVFVSLIPDPDPSQMSFFRSDQFSYARQHIPAIKLTFGRTFTSQPTDYYDQVVQKYIREAYHQPNDNITFIDSQPDPESGAMQEVRLAFRVMYSLVQGSFRPQWNPGSEVDLLQP